MITEEQYKQACEQKEAAEDIMHQYHQEKAQAFKDRLSTNPVFTDEELIYSRYSLCPCGHGMAYPKGCTPQHYWDCSAILKGIADQAVTHTGKLPFAFYDVKGERENETTRGIFKPKPADTP